MSAVKPRRGWRRYLPAATRIRGKLILLHTLFSLALAVVLIAALRPPLRALVSHADDRECSLALAVIAAAPGAEPSVERLGVAVTHGAPSAIGVDQRLEALARATPDTPVSGADTDGDGCAVMWSNRDQRLYIARSIGGGVSTALNSVYLILTLSLLAIYSVIALTLEVIVMPRQVYRPIERVRRADEAVLRGDRDAELIPESQIPADELGAIMRSRNGSIVKLRDQERIVANALDRVEQVASELKRKNHLLEMAKRNLADQDRLASLGMLSAGIAHELNTPLAVLKGSVERLAEESTGADRKRVDLMLRVMRRLEKLSESLLDFARARPSQRAPVGIRGIVDEAWTLVHLDRGAHDVRFANEIDPAQMAPCDLDRMVQVFVNLLRNAVDALAGWTGTRAITVTARELESDGRRWVSVLIRDSGPGIDPDVVSRLFEPFASTKLDARGTGLGLAVAEGIVREHEGVLVGRNSGHPSGGAEFEILLPLDTPPSDDANDMTPDVYTSPAEHTDGSNGPDSIG